MIITLVVYRFFHILPSRTGLFTQRLAVPSTVADQVDTLKGRFGLGRVVSVRDRGMLTQTQIEVLKTHPGIGWISALRSEKVRQLADEKHLQLSLFDEKNLAEICLAAFPDERRVAR